jgi:tryptophan synthase alpha subunit
VCLSSQGYGYIFHRFADGIVIGSAVVRLIDENKNLIRAQPFL